MRLWICFVIAIASGCGGELCPMAAPTAGDECPGTASRCTFADACTGDPMGVIATCTSGRWEVAYDLALARCPTAPVHDGDPCPCAPGARQEAPCSWQCPAGDTERAHCDPRRSAWVIEVTPTSCGS